MGSVIENIRETRGGTKTSVNLDDVSDISNELICRWNGPPMNHCEGVVKAALNKHFAGVAWNFQTTDVRSKLWQVSKVIDRLNSEKPRLNFKC